MLEGKKLPKPPHGPTLVYNDQHSFSTRSLIIRLASCARTQGYLCRPRSGSVAMILSRVTHRGRHVERGAFFTTGSSCFFTCAHFRCHSSVDVAGGSFVKTNGGPKVRVRVVFWCFGFFFPLERRWAHAARQHRCYCKHNEGKRALSFYTLARKQRAVNDTSSYQKVVLMW